MLESLYACIVISMIGLFLWGPIHRRFLTTRPWVALIARYLFVGSGAYSAWLITSVVGWGLIRDHFMPDTPPYMWGSVPSASISIIMAVTVSLLSLPPKRARAIEAAMTELPPEPLPKIEVAKEPHWTDGLSLTEKVSRVIGEMVKGVLKLGWLALICLVGLAAIIAAFLALQGLNDVSTPQAVLIGAAIIAWAIYNSSRK